MSHHKPKVLIFLYNRLFDPLIQGNFWLYIDDYLSDPDNPYELHVVSYEDPCFPLTDAQKDKLHFWHEKSLGWTALRWHPGKGLKNKLFDIVSGFRAVAWLRGKGFRHIVTVASVAGTFGYLYGRTLGLKLFLYSFEPHSEYALDNRMWSEGSLVYKVSNYLERKAAHYATSLASGTRFMQARLEEEWRVDGRFFKIATVANDKKFLFSAQQRKDLRTRLKLCDDQWVLFYPGKFGSLYYTEETAWMFRWLHDLEPRLHFLIVTPHEDEEVQALFDNAGVDRDDYTICHSDYPDIHPYFFAADFAVIAVPPGPSKKFISNIKVGEYLCAGLPFLITAGVSEDYLVASEQEVGVVVEDFRQADIEAAWPEIRRFLEMDPAQRRQHCREVGLGYRGFELLNPIFKSAMDHLVAS